ncbi:flavohemoglobin expression-modulating QEGLA motif protein [Flammeovirgaceae bacterium SG7u.111]|nr:flavohemoglobin expression-modulating QEGLA motif protein [Flammeovirgaceae bacterium SG7u.132]WPO34545.1 flavohemoglobin expression-modulating QEGLA motif protein [Flammeovirgaceae bacterium SG7u.111]
MLKLTVDEMIGRIERGITFNAEAKDGSFKLKIEEYTAYICAAVHNGAKLRPDLLENCLLTQQERWYEEDPHTSDFIKDLPIVMEGLDSRYEYDLNREPAQAIYDTAWGKTVWKNAITPQQREVSLQKHEGFYKVLETLVQKIETKFGACLVFDIHSYNHKRWNRDTPLFNLGTVNVDNVRFGKVISKWVSSLGKMEFPDTENETAINDVFFGKGYLLSNLTNKFENTLVLATEVKKVYCDEDSGELYPQMISLIQKQFKGAIHNSVKLFARTHTSLKVVKRSHLLSAELEQNIIDVDRQLFHLVRNFEILYYINPINIESEKKKFFNSKFKVNPTFKYRSLLIDPFEFKSALYNIQVNQILDPEIRQLYQSCINAYADKVDILSSIGTQKFLYNSLRYFGEPNAKDLANAQYLMYSPEPASSKFEENLSDKDAEEIFRQTVAEYGFECKIETVPNLASKALVLNSTKTVRIKKGAKFSEKSVAALAHHEIGVHMVTTINARLQTLNLMRLGMPLNTLTQEGLAVLSEYLSGNVTIKRLKELALRVMAIQLMLQDKDFSQVFAYLVEEGKMDTNAAYYLTARIFRGGGFTKDYLYLRGFRNVLLYYLEGHSLDNLLIGKTSLQYIDTLNSLVERKILLPPKYKTTAYEQPVENSEILNFIISGIR